MSYQQPAPDTENAASEPKRGARGRRRGEGRQRDVTKLMTAAREKYETGRLKGAIGLFKRALNRSEEHTSELQSLMRISYAVFCLKKKNHMSKPRPSTQMDIQNEPGQR